MGEKHQFGLLYHLREALAPPIPVGDHVSVTDLSDIVTVTPAVGADGVLLQVLAQNVRMRLDGEDPDSSSGFQLQAGGLPIRIDTPAGVTIKLTEETAGAIVEYQSIRRGAS